MFLNLRVSTILATIVTAGCVVLWSPQLIAREEPGGDIPAFAWIKSGDDHPLIFGCRALHVPAPPPDLGRRSEAIPYALQRLADGGGRWCRLPLEAMSGNIKNLALFLAFGYASFPAPAEASQNPNNYSKSANAISAIRVNPGGNNFNSTTGCALNRALSKWNVVCGSNVLTLSKTASPEGSHINIHFRKGVFNRGSNPNRCAVTEMPTSATVPNAEIYIFEETRNGADCTGMWDELVQHELGHALGLGHSSCSNNIMFNGNIAGNQATPADCSAVDDFWYTTEEEDEDLDPDTGGDGGPGGGEDCLECDPNSPIIVDLDRKGFHLAGLEDSVLFDIDADGILEEISWTRADQLDGFLVLDRNENGVIDDGRELFGNYTLLLGGGVAPHGYIALAEFDQQAHGGNGDEMIDSRDAVFSLLRLWIDSDHDGYSADSELVTLGDAGVVRLAFRFYESRETDRFGNWFRYNSKAWLEGSGNSEVPVKTSDVFFVLAE